MEKEDETERAEEWLKDLPANSEIQSFKPEEMLLCGKCRRTSPPTRTNCFYCGNPLPVSDLQKQILKLNLRRLESWEKGFNVIILPQEVLISPQDSVQIAAYLELEKEDLEKILMSGKALPLARVESRIEAETIVEKLAAKNIESRILADEKLKIEIAPRRLRGIEFFDDRISLILFNNDKISEVEFRDVSLIVIGSIFERKIESTESFKRKDRGKVLESSETGTDEILIDIYPQSDFTGYRIESKGFDFSCLEKDKSLLAKENMKRLAEKLQSILPGAKYDNDYSKIRAELGKIWEIEETNSTGEVERKSFGKVRRTNTVTVSNQSQFTRYSRLQKQML